MLREFFIRSDGKYIRVDIREILYLESFQNYVRIVTRAKIYMVLMSLRQFEQELPASQFCRVYRSFIVSISHINSFDHEEVYIGDSVIPINPSYKNLLQTGVRAIVSDTRTKDTETSKLGN